MDFSHLHVEFFVDAVENRSKSAQAGRPIFDDVEMIRIRVAGDPKSVLVAPAESASAARDPASNRRLTYAQLHAEPYQAFKQGIEYVGSGTPLAELPFMTKAKAEELKRLNIHTAEALAGLDGANLAKTGMGGRELKEQAQAFLDSAAGTAEVTRLAGENAALKDRLDAMQAELEAMANGTGPGPSPGDGSPFQSWAKEDIVNWIVANGGDKPHHMCGHAKIVGLADTLNAELAREAA